MATKFLNQYVLPSDNHSFVEGMAELVMAMDEQKHSLRKFQKQESTRQKKP